MMTGTQGQGVMAAALSGVKIDPGTAIAVRPRVRASRVLSSDVVRIASVVSIATSFQPKGKNKEAVNEEYEQALGKARRELAKRLVTHPNDPTMPVVADVTFEAVLERDRKNGQVKHVRIRGRFTIPSADGGFEEVTGVPLVSVNMNWIKEESEGMYSSTGTYPSMFFKPKKADGPYVIVPIGLASEKLLANYNDVTEQAGDKENIIDPIEHDLDKPGIRKVVLQPVRGDNIDPEDKNNDLVKWDPRRRVVGYIDGKVCMTTPTSSVPTRGADGQFPLGVWRYIEGETVVFLNWLGLFGHVREDDRVNVLEFAWELNPYEVLGMQIDELWFDRLETRVTEIKDEFGLDEENPAWAYLVRAGVIKPDDDMAHQAKEVREAADVALRKVTDDLQAAKSEIERHFMSLPTLNELIGEKPIEEVIQNYDNEDPTVKLIAETLGEFDGNRQIHVHLREHLLRRAERAANHVEEPEEPAEAPVEEAVAEPSEPGKKIPNLSGLKYRGKVNGVSPAFDTLEFLGVTPGPANEVLAVVGADGFTPDRDKALAVLNKVLGDGRELTVEDAKFADVLGKAKAAVIARCQKLLE